MKCSQAIGFLCLSVAVVCFALFAGSAHAGFTSVYVSPVNGGPSPDYSWDPVDDGKLGVDEVWDASTGSDYGFSVWGSTDSDPVLTITKDILNSTTMTWIGYNISLDPNDTDTFVGVPSSGGTSGGMTLGSSDAYNLIWTTPNPVLPGQTVTFTFQVNVPDTGPFNFTLSQSPVIPEPATCLLALAGLAGCLALRRRG